MDMNITPVVKSIKDLLISGKQFSIPRFQREYSWEKKHYKEFLDDMLKCLSIDEGEIRTSSYFVGSMLFIGDYTEKKSKHTSIAVVDGQQRITTITILFSALSDRFKDINEETLSRQVFRYIITQDDNGENVKVLDSKTHYPYFAFFIQDIDKREQQTPNTEEEELIKEAFDFLYDSLGEDKLKSKLKKNLPKNNQNIDNLTYVDILKAVRDQVLETNFISISTPDKKNANMIFEILNAKGKKLSDVDLIKNKIFEVLNELVPADFAEVKWTQINENLMSRSETVGMVTFYRHFWMSNYKKATANNLYDQFIDEIKPANEVTYKQFLEKMEKDSELYIQIINPTREDYNNRKQYFWLVQSLNAIINHFNGVQVRMPILALMKAKNRKLITAKKFKESMIAIENFQFVYTTLTSGRANAVEGIYSKFSIALNKAVDKTIANKIIDEELIEKINKKYPPYQQFLDKFIQLTFSKVDNADNVKTKYIMNKLNCLYENNDVYSDVGTVEHILSETKGENALNIGNLILLEEKLNNEADSKDYEDKKSIYLKSSYKWVQEFSKQNKDWDENKIKDRAVNLANLYYSEILKKDLPKK